MGSELSKRFGDTIMSGPLTGVRLASESSWGDDRASMLLGLYEREVLDRIAQRPEPYDLLINVGAGDGYYAAGCLRQGFAASVIAFETSEHGRRNVLAAAGANGVSDRLEIHGSCSLDDLLSLRLEGSALVLMDVEGAEFDLLTLDVLMRLRSAELIIELHEWREGSEAKSARLVADAERVGFVVDWLRTGARDLSGFAELSGLSDDDRWALCSEGRPMAMRWLCLTPGSDKNTGRTG